MNLKSALNLVVADSRDLVTALYGAYELSERDAIESVRCYTHRDIDSTIADPELRGAYNMMLDANDAEITAALTDTTT
jgi:hypothetical protein